MHDVGYCQRNVMEYLIKWFGTAEEANEFIERVVRSIEEHSDDSELLALQGPTWPCFAADKRAAYLEADRIIAQRLGWVR